MKRGLIFKCFLILLITASIFITIDYLFGKKIDKIIRIKDDERVYRVQNEYFHHGFLKNYSTNKARWGNRFYKFCSDHNGFKYDCISNYESDFDVAFIGDSFTEGIGLEYEDTFVGLFKKFTKLKVVNLGVSSYSPYIYRDKVIYLLENKLISFNHLIVAVDLSDLNDDRLYNNTRNLNENDTGSNKYHQYNLISKTLHKIKPFLRENLIITDFILRQIWWIGLRNFFKNHSNHYIAYNNIESSWSYDPKFNDKKDLTFMIQNMTDLASYLKKKDIKLTLMIHPHPASILYDTKLSLYKKTWQEFCLENCDNFIDSFSPFFDLEKDKNEIIKEFYIKGDIHLNKNGNKFQFSHLIQNYN